MSGGGACGKRRWYAEVGVGTGAKLGGTMRKWARGMELLLPGAGCPGQLPDVRDAGCPVDTGRMSGFWIGDKHDELHGRNCNSGAKFGQIGGWKLGKVDGKLDLPATHEIRGSNPTKLHHTNKSQKNLGLFLVGIFRFRTKTTKSS